MPRPVEGDGERATTNGDDDEEEEEEGESPKRPTSNLGLLGLHFFASGLGMGHGSFPFLLFLSVPNRLHSNLFFPHLFSLSSHWTEERVGGEGDTHNGLYEVGWRRRKRREKCGFSFFWERGRGGGRWR